jgi:AcrR family transcriptional regulator
MRDGYAATSVRDIAADADVNVALINRYFRSKAGLLEACLAATANLLLDPAGYVRGLSEILQVIGERVSAANSGT